MSTLWLSKAWPKTALPSGALARVAPLVARATRWAIVPLRVAAARPVTALLFAGLCHRLFPWCFWGLLGAIVAVAALDTLTARGQGVSSLAHAVKSAYWRFYLMFRWDRLCKSACVEEVLKTEHGQVLNRPRLKFRYPWQLWHWRYRIRQTPNGLSCVVDGTTVGRPSEGFEGAPALSFGNTMCAKDLIVTEHPRRKSLTLFHFVYRDPFAKTIYVDDLGFSQDWAIIPVGKDSNGSVVYKDLRLASLLVGNLGSGKSSECWVILKGLIEQACPFRVRIADPKGGMEFVQMKGKAYDYESNPIELANFLRRALADLHMRQKEMSELGFNKWDPKNPKFPTDRFPLDVMIIDELVTFILMMKNTKININGKDYDAKDAFIIYMTQIRAAGFTVVACSQLAQKAILELLRDLFTYKTCLRVGSDDMVRMILGDPKQYPAHRIPPGDEYGGIGYMDSGTGPVKYRAGFATDNERTVICEMTEFESRKYWPQKSDASKVIKLDMSEDSDKEEVAA